VGSPFQAALEARDLGGLRACAKADLHVHAGVTSGDRAFLKARTGLDIRPVDRVLASMDDMHAWVRGQTGTYFDRMPGHAVPGPGRGAAERLPDLERQAGAGRADRRPPDPPAVRCRRG
jgi:hypothetical protein